MNIFNIIVINLSFVIGELDFAVHVKGEKQMIFLHSTQNKMFPGGSSAADTLAAKHHMVNMGEIIPDSNFYLLRYTIASFL